MEKVKTYQSQSFFTIDVTIDDIFTIEDFTDEHQMIAQTTADYIEQEVKPVLPKMEKQNFSEVKKLIRKAGELGLLGTDIPEDYGGIALDKISSIVITEIMATSRSFSITYSGQVGIGSLPIVYYGTEMQKADYLLHVASGEKIGAYALTEPNAGTDALSIKTTARLSKDRRYYILNGEKQFITNSSFADFFILYAKIDGDKFTAFIVDRDTEGITIGPEEQKMGLKGSSTTSIVLNDVHVPVENVLGEIGKGHSIAFNILNIGRHKISATCLGTGKRALELATQHATERIQFERSLSEFNLIKEKIALMAVKIFAMESMVYRTAGEFERGAVYSKQNRLSFVNLLKIFAPECSANKVFASEALDAIVDESLQIHGGYGFTSEYEIETLYRDSRINRIFEGTNEINRMLIANAILNEKDGYPSTRTINGTLSGRFGSEWSQLNLLRELTFFLVQHVKESIPNYSEEQELLACISDFAINIFALESSLLRIEKMFVKGNVKKISHYEAIVKVLAEEIAGEFFKKAISLSANVPSSFKQKLFEIMKFLQNKSFDSINEKRKIAEVIFKGSY